MIRKILLTGIVLTSLSFRQASAQDKPVPPPREFNPETSEGKRAQQKLQFPEYIITGSDNIRFGDDNKYPLEIGNVADFLARLGRGEREKRFRSTYPSRAPLEMQKLDGSKRSLLIRAGYGLFHTPYAEAWFAKSFPKGDVNSHVLFEKSDGFVQRSDYSKIGFDVGGGTYLPSDADPLVARSRIEGDFRIVSNKYFLYANKAPEYSPKLGFDRTKTEINYSAELIARRNEIADYHVRLSAEHTLLWEYLSLLDSMRLDDYHFFENIFGLDAGVRLAIGPLPVEGHLALYVSGNSLPDKNAQSPFFMKLDASSMYDIQSDLHLDFALNAFVYRGSEGAMLMRIYPNGKLTYTFDPDFHLFLSYLGSVERRTVRSIYNENPYTALGVPLMHKDVPMHAQLGLEYDNRNAISGRVLLEYINASNFPIYVRMPYPTPQQWEILYSGNTSLFNLRAEASYVISPENQLFANLIVRSTSNSEFSGSIPYMPDYEIGCLYRHTFPFNLDLTATMQLIGRRIVEGKTSPAFLLLGLEVEYQITPAFGFFFSIQNLSNQTYEPWIGYSGRPFFPMLGITARF